VENKLNLQMQIRVLDYTLAWQFRARLPSFAK
jgi:hypothetical protein